jgi:hypothetical protein
MILNLVVLMLAWSAVSGVVLVVVGFMKRSAVRVGYGVLLLGGAALLLVFAYDSSSKSVMLATKGILAVQDTALLIVVDVIRNPGEILLAVGGVITFATALFLVANAP